MSEVAGTVTPTRRSAVGTVLDADSFRRPDPDTSDPMNYYVQSYLWIRVIVGSVGIALPIVMVVAEAFLGGGVHIRGSISAYYHTPMRDVFVGFLAVVSVLLVAYMSGRPKSWEFRYSLVAGVALALVIAFPTSRPAGLPDCRLDPVPTGCGLTQHWFGEGGTAWVHGISAVVFILGLAAISFVFGRRAQKHEADRRKELVQFACGVAIFVALAWAAIGGLMDYDLWGITPIYAAEFLSIVAFGVSWFVQGAYLRGLLYRSPTVQT